MKLSEIKGDRCLEVIADMIEPLSAIAADEVVMEMFTPKAPPEGVEPRKFFAQRMREGLPRLLRDHKSEVIQVLSVLDGTPVDEYRATLTMPKLMADALEVLTDRDVTTFLASPGMTETASGSASAPTLALA